MIRPFKLRPIARRSLLVSLLAPALVMSACSDGDGTVYVPSRIRAAPEIPAADYAERRQQVLEQIPDGILIVHARPVEKTMEQWGFVQDPSFYYLTGLGEIPGAIIALDGDAGESHLFLPPAPQSFGMAVQGLVPGPGPATAEALGFDEAHDWIDFPAWFGRRAASGTRTVYVDEARRPEATGLPSGMPPVAGDRTLWHRAITATFPTARLESAKSILMEMKAVKSPAEVRILERNARMTVESLKAVAARLSPGVRQRDTEAAMVAACVQAGGQGPSFWPWTMSGPNAHTSQLAGAFFRYDQGDRTAEAGELVRVDIGCAGGFYGADVGRTLPVTGSFTEGQAEAWDLLIEGYLAGLDAMAHGVPVDDVRAASIAAVRSEQGSLTTDVGRAAAEAILAGGAGVWHIHGVGIESGEDIPPTLGTGMVVAYEPGFSVGPDAYYLEDMILVTDDGHRVLSTGLPYSAREIERFMAR